MDFYSEWDLFNNNHYVTTEKCPSKNEIMECFAYNLMMLCATYLPINNSPFHHLIRIIPYVVEGKCIPVSELSSFKMKEEEIQKVNKEICNCPTEIYFSLKLIHCLLLCWVRKEMSIHMLMIKEENHKLQIKEHIDKVKSQNRHILINEEHKQHLIDFLLCPLKTNSKIMVNINTYSEEYRFQTNTLTIDFYQFDPTLQEQAVSTKDENKNSHLLVFSKDKWRLSYFHINPFLTYNSTFLLFKNKCSIPHNIVSFYKRTFQNTYTNIFHNFSVESSKIIKYLRFHMIGILTRIDVEIQNILGMNAKLAIEKHNLTKKRLTNMESKKTVYSEEEKELMYYYIIDPEMTLLLENQNVEDIFPYFDSNEINHFEGHPGYLFISNKMNFLNKYSLNVSSFDKLKYEKHCHLFQEKNRACFTRGVKSTLFHCMGTKLRCCVEELLSSLYNMNIINKSVYQGKDIVTMKFFKDTISIYVELTFAKKLDMIEKQLSNEITAQFLKIHNQLTKLSKKKKEARIVIHNREIIYIGKDVFWCDDNEFYKDDLVQYLHDKIKETPITLENLIASLKLSDDVTIKIYELIYSLLHEDPIDLKRSIRSAMCTWNNEKLVQKEKKKQKERDEKNSLANFCELNRKHLLTLNRYHDEKKHNKELLEMLKK